MIWSTPDHNRDALYAIYTIVLLLNTSHLEMLMWWPKGGPTVHKDDLGPASAPSSRYQAWNSRGQQLSIVTTVMRTISMREKKGGGTKGIITL